MLTAFTPRGTQDPDGDAGAVANAQTVAATFGAGDLDVFSFAAHSGDAITFTVSDTGDTLEPQAYLHAPDGVRLATQ